MRNGDISLQDQLETSKFQTILPNGLVRINGQTCTDKYMGLVNLFLKKHGKNHPGLWREIREHADDLCA